MKATRNMLTRQRAKTLRKKDVPMPMNFVFFAEDGLVSSNGTALVFARNKAGKTPPELQGKALNIADLKRIAKNLPKGKFGKDIELSADKGQLFVKDSRGVTHQAPLSLRDHAPKPFKDLLPQHDDYYEVAANPRELRAAIMSVEQLEADGLARGEQPSITLRLSKNPEHPIEICGKGGNCAAVNAQKKSLLAHVFGRVSKWLKAVANDSTTHATPSEKKELVKV